MVRASLNVKRKRGRHTELATSGVLVFCFCTALATSARTYCNVCVRQHRTSHSANDREAGECALSVRAERVGALSEYLRVCVCVLLVCAACVLRECVQSAYKCAKCVLIVCLCACVFVIKTVHLCSVVEEATERVIWEGGDGAE